MTPDRIEIRQLDVEAVRPLRTQVLRPGFDDGELLHYEGDEASEAHHFGAVDTEDNQIVGVVSYMPEQLSVEGESAEVRLRGMAVRPDLQRRGVGSHLLSTTLTKIAVAHPKWRRVWAAARTSVTGFYAGHGFEAVGPRFEIPSVGPHQRMVRRLPRVVA